MERPKSGSKKKTDVTKIKKNSAQVFVNQSYDKTGHFYLN